MPVAHIVTEALQQRHESAAWIWRGDCIDQACAPVRSGTYARRSSTNRHGSYTRHEHNPRTVCVAYLPDATGDEADVDGELQLMTAGSLAQGSCGAVADFLHDKVD